MFDFYSLRVLKRAKECQRKEWQKSAKECE